MAQINIVTTQEEQDAVIQALSKIGDEMVAMSAIAKEAGVGKNRVRYILADLLEAGKIERNLVKAFNERYMRYSYRVL